MLQNTASRTAASVASNVLRLAHHPVYGRLVPPEMVEPTRWFLKAVPGLEGLAYRSLESPWMLRYLNFMEGRTLPGISLHNVLRKRWIEAQTRAALQAGAEQVIVLGAGFDTLAYRLHREYLAVRWYEIDHPATQAVKVSALRKHRVLPKRGNSAGNLALQPVDFTQMSLAQALASLPGYRPRARSVFIMEGLLMYLREQDVRRLLMDVSQTSGAGSVILGTILEPDRYGHIRLEGASPLASAQLKRISKMYLWGVSPLDLPAFLQESGFSLVNTARTDELLKHFLPSAPANPKLPSGEYLFRAVKP